MQEIELPLTDVMPLSYAPQACKPRRAYTAIASMASHRSIEVAIYTLGQIKTCFAKVGAVTRQDIAEAVGRHIEAFRHSMPKPRKPWQAEDRRMAMFCAAALVLTHFQLGASRLFDSLA